MFLPNIPFHPVLGAQHTTKHARLQLQSHAPAAHIETHGGTAPESNE